MPSKIVDLSARSAIIRDEPWDLHFWESTPVEVLEFLKNPRKQLSQMGIQVPEDCRIETVFVNHDSAARWTNGFSTEVSAADDGPIIICSVGGGNRALDFYRVTLYAHHESDVGRFRKELLHAPDEEQMT